MAIKLEKNDTQAEILIDMNNWSLQSYNLVWERQEAPPSPLYAIFGKALKGGATLLISQYLIPALEIPGAGWIFGIVLIGIDLAPQVAELLWPTTKDTEIIDVKNANATETSAYLRVPAAGNSPINWPVDALIGAQFYWIFNDANVQAHSIEITVEMKYYSYQLENNTTISTSVDIVCPRDAGNTRATARYVTSGEYLAYVHGTQDQFDFYNVTVSYNQCIHLRLNMTSPLYANLYLYAPNGNLLKKSERSLNATEYINYFVGLCPTGNYSIKVEAANSEGLYDLKIVVSTALQLKVEARETSGAEITNVKTWIDCELNYTQVTTFVAVTDHIVEVESTFIRLMFPDIYEYRFVGWEDGSTDNPRTLPMNQSRTITAYYQVEYAGGIASIGDI